MIIKDEVKTDAQQPVGPDMRADDGVSAKIELDDLAELRDRKNFEYLRAVMTMEDPLAAGVGALNGDLMIFANHMQRIILPALRTLPAEPVSLTKLIPAVEAYGRVARQVERLAALTDRLNRQSEAGRNAAAKMMAKPVGGDSAST